MGPQTRRFPLPARGTGPGWAVVGSAETLEWQDTIYLAGFDQGCAATRVRKYSLIVPSGPMVTERIGGDAITALRIVVYSWNL